MNHKNILYIIGWILKLEGFVMLFPLFVAVCYRESSGLTFVFCSLIGIFLGQLLTIKRPNHSAFYARDGFLTVAISWIAISILGCLPFYFSKEIPSFLDALFEIVSGFTTTGASILTDVEHLSKCMLFWRSFSHWFGGMGVLVFMLAILPMGGGGENLHLMRAESPGPSVSKLVPKLRTTAVYLYGIYIAITLLEVILLLFGRMSVFDALCLSFGTAGTGGFGLLNSSISSYSHYIQSVITIFMLLSGVNFTLYFFLLMRRTKEAFQMEEVRWYFIIYTVTVLLITCNVAASQGHFFETFHHAAFQVASVMTTTGYSTLDYNTWPEFSRSLIILIMFIGACAGSTGGGMKISRFIIYFKCVGKELSYLIHPRSVKILKMDGKKIEHEVIRSANAYLMAYIMIFITSLLLLSLNGFDFTTNFTAVAATLNNIGPGLNLVGPAGNFSMFSNGEKLVLIFDMLAGRLEIFPMLLLITPRTWRK